MASAPSEPTTIAEVTGASGPVRIRLLGIPATRLPSGELKPLREFATDDGEGGVDVVDADIFITARAMFACGSYTMKLKEYLPRLVFQCQGCQQKLTEESQEEQHFEFGLQALDVSAFQMHLDAPAVRCPKCGRWNVLWSDETARAVEAAVRQALGIE
jgi:hypothetical protein